MAGAGEGLSEISRELTAGAGEFIAGEVKSIMGTSRLSFAKFWSSFMLVMDDFDDS